MLSLYHDADTPVHALPAGVKLLVLFAVGSALFFVRSILDLGIALAVVVLLYAVARVPWRTAWRQLRPVLPFTALIIAAQLVLTDWRTAVLVGERILALVLLANLVTLSTRTTAMIAAIEVALSPLRPLGVRPERVGLLVALTIRFIPVVKEHADQVRAAQKARGVERSFVFLTPLLIKTLKMADGLGEALDARGVDTDPAAPAPRRRERAPRRGRGIRRHNRSN